MARPVPFNTRGIYGIKTQGAPVVGASEVTYNFATHPFVHTPYNGILLVYIAEPIPSGTTGTLPVVFQTGTVTKSPTKVGGGALTAADITGTGYYLFFYDRNGVLQALGSL